MKTYKDLADEAEQKYHSECKAAYDALDSLVPGSVIETVNIWAALEPNNSNTVKGFLQCCDPRRYFMRDEAIVVLACAYRYACALPPNGEAQRSAGSGARP